MKGEFNEKVVLITGGSSGIGRATAIAFAREGAKVVIASRRLVEGEDTIHQIQTEGGEGIFVATDVSKPSDVKKMMQKIVAHYGRLDCAFNNAGISKMDAFTSLSEEDWDYTIGINLKGIWLCLKQEIPQMLEQGNGTIVNMSAVAALAFRPGFSIYSASKAGIIGLSKALAIEFAQSNIRINVVSPAAIETEILKTLPPDFLTKLAQEHPVGRIGQCEEVAEAILWLCSDKASFITGHNLVIDGGVTAL